MMRIVFRAMDVVTWALATLAAIAVVALMVHVCVDVVLRAVFNAPLTGTIIFVSNYYMVLAVCLPLAMVERNSAQISVEVLTELLPQGSKRHLYNWTLLFSMAVFGLVGWASFQEALAQMKLNKFAIEGGMRFIIWYGYFAVPFGYGLAAVWMALKFLIYLTGREDLMPSGTDLAGDDIDKVLYD